ncbi:uncharacterized protein [Diadema antillarum]|uniref:uncharacterized protein n=1 Tax=Diadema antillarum TaxID=105358 RepID=UPI003A8BA00C
MAATNVTVLCPNGRRQNVKVTANTRILEVIENVCQKQKYNPDDYNLKHNRTVLDVQVPFRYANLPNNVKLELVKASSPRSQSGTAVVALQLPSGERLQRSFDSSTSLWQLLQHWEKEGDRPSLTASFFSSDGGTLHPVCIYMREEIVGEARLKATTLKGLGLTGGRAIIRLLHREVKLPSAPEPAQPQPVATVNPAIPCNLTPENQMVSSQTPASCADQDTSMKGDGDIELMQEEGKCSITPDVVPQATCVENTPVDNKQVSSELPGDAARECSIPDNRDEMPMDTEMTNVKVEMEGPDFEMAECESSAASQPCTSESEERVVRPKKEPVEAGATHFSASTSAGEGESGGRKVADDTSHNPNSGSGLTVDEYAKRRIHSLLAREAPEGDSPTVERARREVDMIESQTGVALNDYARRRIQNLLEKEEKMVQSMQTALMESMVQAVRSQQPTPQPRHPAMAFSDFKFPESDAADSPGKGKKKAPSKRPALDQPCERNQLVFSADREMMMRHGPDDVPDEFFDVTVNDIQSMLSSLRHQSSERERDLETRAMRERREEQKMSQYEKAIVTSRTGVYRRQPSENQSSTTAVVHRTEKGAQTIDNIEVHVLESQGVAAREVDGDQVHDCTDEWLEGESVVDNECANWADTMPHDTSVGGGDVQQENTERVSMRQILEKLEIMDQKMDQLLAIKGLPSEKNKLTGGKMKLRVKKNKFLGKKNKLLVKVNKILGENKGEGQGKSDGKGAPEDGWKFSHKDLALLKTQSRSRANFAKRFIVQLMSPKELAQCNCSGKSSNRSTRGVVRAIPAAILSKVVELFSRTLAGLLMRAASKLRDLTQITGGPLLVILFIAFAVISLAIVSLILIFADHIRGCRDGVVTVTFCHIPFLLQLFHHTQQLARWSTWRASCYGSGYILDGLLDVWGRVYFEGVADFWCEALCSGQVEVPYEATDLKELLKKGTYQDKEGRVGEFGQMVVGLVKLEADNTQQQPSADELPQDETGRRVPRERPSDWIYDVAKRMKAEEPRPEKICADANVDTHDLQLKKIEMIEGLLREREEVLRRKEEELKLVEDTHRQAREVVVRVHFPERVILQGFFRPHETVEAVKEFVRSNLADKKQQFYLFTTPPKTVLKDTSQTLFKAKLFPAALVYFGTQDTRDYNLHEEILCNLDSPLQAESAVAKQMNTGAVRVASASQSSSGSSTSGASTSSAASSSSFSEGASGSSTSQGTPGPVSATSSQQKRQASPSSGSAVGSTKVPKWFKMGEDKSRLVL